MLLPALGYYAYTLKHGTAQVEAWLPKNDAGNLSYENFIRRFGDDQFLVVTWPNCDLSDNRLKAVSNGFEALAKTRPELKILSVENSQDSVSELSNRRTGIDQQEAVQRLRGISIGKNNACFITIRVGKAEASSRTDLIDAVQQAAFSSAGISSEELIIAGEPLQVSIIDTSTRNTIRYFVAPSSIVALAVAWYCLGYVRLTILVFSFAGIGQLLGLALVSFFLGEISAVLVVLPTLIFMLTLSAAIHLTNYYIDAGAHKSKQSGFVALNVGAKPCILATLTTVFGFGSLAVSQLEPVWQFGALAALGLLVSSAILLTVFPAACELSAKFPTRGVYSAASAEKEEGWKSRLAAFTNRFSTIITVSGLIVFTLALMGIPQLKTSTEFADMFPESSPAVQSLNWVRDNLGPIDSLEFVVEFEESSSSDLLHRLRWLRALSNDLQASEHVHSTMSALTFLPEIPDGAGLRSTVQRAVLRRKVEASFQQLMDSGVLAIDDGAQCWRLSTKIQGMRNETYQLIRSSLQEICQEHIDRGLPGSMGSQESFHPTFEITGLRTVVESARRALLTDLGGSFLAAFVLITPVMMLIVRGVFSGLVLMIPNTLPVAIVFGGMGWIGIQLDVASILTASVALGIAVDDTLHFMSWFLQKRRCGESVERSVRAAIETCARPMLHTSIICTGAMLPFFFCSFLPTSKFALLMILILSGAILGDLILLPAIVQSPLGRIIGQKKDKTARERYSKN